MRKTIILILLVVFCILCLNVKTEKEDSITVFQETDYNYYIYDLDVSLEEITTKNINKYFKNYQVISIRPYNNPIYERFIPFKSYNFDTNKSIKTNINEFESMYIKYINDNHYTEEAQKLKYNGIRIEQVSIYVTKSELDLILSNNRFKLAK